MSVEWLLDRQAGVLSTAQAVSCGISARSVRRRVTSGAWEPLHPGVFLAGGHRLTDEARVRAAWLWAGGAAATVTGPAAAYWHGMLERAPTAIEITVARRTHLSPQPGVRLRRRDLHGADRVGIREVWVADRPLAALETAVVLPDGSAFLDRALQRHVRFPALHRAHCRNLGRHGSPRAGALLAAAGDRADSAAERMLVTLLRRAGVSGWVLGHPFGPYRLDLAFPAAGVAVEVDGWAWHVDPDRFRADRRKGNALTRAGWVLLRFTWHDLTTRPQSCVAEILEALGLAGAVA